MNQNDLAYYRGRYSQLDEGEFEDLCHRVYANADYLTEEAAYAFGEVLATKGRPIESFISATTKAEIDVKIEEAIREAMDEVREEKPLSSSDLFLGWFGTIAGLSIVAVSLAHGRVDGALAGTACLACSVWILKFPPFR